MFQSWMAPDLLTLLNQSASRIVSTIIAHCTRIGSLLKWISSQSEDKVESLNHPGSSAANSHDTAKKTAQVRFLDTMSLHIIVNGMTSDQRLLMQKFSAMKAKDNDNPNYTARPKFTGESSLNNLRDVHQLYCGREAQRVS